MEFLKKELFPRDHSHLPIFLSLLALMIGLTVVVTLSKYQTELKSNASQPTCVQPPQCYFDPKFPCKLPQNAKVKWCIKTPVSACGEITAKNNFPDLSPAALTTYTCFWNKLQACLNNQNVGAKLTVKIVTNNQTTVEHFSFDRSTNCSISVIKAQPPLSPTSNPSPTGFITPQPSGYTACKNAQGACYGTKTCPSGTSPVANTYCNADVQYPCCK